MDKVSPECEINKVGGRGIGAVQENLGIEESALGARVGDLPALDHG